MFTKRNPTAHAWFLWKLTRGDGHAIRFAWWANTVTRLFWSAKKSGRYASWGVSALYPDIEVLTLGYPKRLVYATRGDMPPLAYTLPQWFPNYAVNVAQRQ